MTAWFYQTKIHHFLSTAKINLVHVRRETVIGSPNITINFQFSDIRFKHISNTSVTNQQQQQNF